MTDINYLNAISLGKITNWADSKESMIIPISFPGEDAGKTEAFDTLGVVAYISIEGRWVGTFEDIQSYISYIKAVIDGYQSSASIIRSPFVNSVDADDNQRIGSISKTTSVGANQCNDTAAQFVSDGITTDDKVKNLITGEVSTITAVAANTLTITDNIFTVTGTPYAVTASIGVKVQGLDARWELPGMTICNYSLKLLQVNEFDAIPDPGD